MIDFNHFLLRIISIQCRFLEYIYRCKIRGWRERDEHAITQVITQEQPYSYKTVPAVTCTCVLAPVVADVEDIGCSHQLSEPLLWYYKYTAFWQHYKDTTRTLCCHECLLARQRPTKMSPVLMLPASRAWSLTDSDGGSKSSHRCEDSVFINHSSQLHTLWKS